MIVVIDLFCGVGGFSTGAALAGAEVALAVDAWDDALDVHALNHPFCAHWIVELGGDIQPFCERVMTFLVNRYGHRDSYHLHIHASPPCQNFSTANGVSPDVHAGLRMVTWTINLIHELAPNSWTLEQVNHRMMRPFIDAYNGKLVKCCDYGVPQSRKRLLLGTIDWDKVELMTPSTPLDILQNVGERPNIQWGDYVQMNRAGNWDANAATRPMTHMSYTITASGFGGIKRIKDKKGVIFSIREGSAIQTFPSTYKFGNITKAKQRKMIGNAVPPQLACQIIKSLKTT